MAVIVGIILIFGQIVIDFHIELDTRIVSALELNFMEQQATIEVQQFVLDLLALVVGRALIIILVVFQLVTLAELTFRIVCAQDCAAFRAALGVLIVVLGEQREVPHGTEISSAHFVILLKVGCLCLYYNYR